MYGCVYMNMYKCVCSDKKRMPTRSRVPDGAGKNEKEDDEEGECTSSDGDDSDECKVIDKKVVGEVAAVVAVVPMNDDEKEVGMNAMMRDVVVERVANDGDGEEVVPPEFREVVPPAGAAPQGVKVDEGKVEVEPKEMKAVEGRVFRDEGRIKKSLRVLGGASMIDIRMHVNEASVLVDLHESAEDMLDRGKRKLAKLGGMVHTHIGALRYGSNVLGSKMETLRATSTKGEEDEEESDKVALQSEILLAESNLKQIKAVQGMLDSIIEEHKGMTSFLKELAQDTGELHELLRQSESRANDFAEDMRAANWKGWGTLMRLGLAKELERRDQKFDERWQRDADRQDDINGREAMMSRLR